VLFGFIIDCVVLKIITYDVVILFVLFPIGSKGPMIKLAVSA